MNGALFWTLVRNEMDLFKWRGSKHIKKIAIGCLVLLLAGGVLLWKALHGEPIVDKLINVAPVFHAFGFVAFALSLASINREWKEGSFYWWMSLPYSRWPMLWAKLVGVMLTFLRLLLYFYVVVKVLLALVIYFEDPGQFPSLFWHSLMADGKALLQVIPFAFTLSAIGFFVSCLIFSRFRPYAFMGWIVYGLSFSFLHDQLFLIGSLGFLSEKSCRVC
ncbi:ABC transporter permease subunit [Polycladomyces subterraneus]|uniref:ABC transporter permease subunit n=1 Tax=Polycladomyces subterraneus TaxID=1016997 RepID=A0ABT8IJC6_9BACL|nr:ABC transporter permease subunit [Polycladomyces subterraneus]MDN4592843.1 ABC transporter permease subunit [Polycladomyces subterraneus]